MGTLIVSAPIPGFMCSPVDKNTFRTPAHQNTYPINFWILQSPFHQDLTLGLSLKMEMNKIRRVNSAPIDHWYVRAVTAADFRII